MASNRPAASAQVGANYFPFAINSFQMLRAGLIYHLPAVVEMRDYPAKGVFLHQFVQVGDQEKAVVSF